MTIDQLVASFRNAGQGQVFAFWDSLDAAGRATLAAQAREIDLAEVERLNRTLVLKTAGAAGVRSGASASPRRRTFRRSK